MMWKPRVNPIWLRAGSSSAGVSAAAASELRTALALTGALDLIAGAGAVPDRMMENG